jgi:N-acetylglucosaminyldiphosphoundecaprenol N-acetyl-beta-D-mannosaminyltransferase
VTILGIPIHAVTRAETQAWVVEAVAAREPKQICTPNPEFLMTARRDPAFRDVLRASDLNIPDGIGLLWAARWLGQRLPERVAGSDLVGDIAGLAARHGWRLFLLGAAPGVAERAASVLRAAHPGLIIAGTESGSPRPEEAERLITMVTAARPDVLLVAYGAPAQDKWIAAHRERLNVPVSMGVGGSLDFVAGMAPRAPHWLQRLGLEWLYRLARQPWRARRIYTAVVEFPLAVLRQ